MQRTLEKSRVFVLFYCHNLVGLGSSDSTDERPKGLQVVFLEAIDAPDKCDVYDRQTKILTEVAEGIGARRVSAIQLNIVILNKYKCSSKIKKPYLRNCRINLEIIKNRYRKIVK